MELYWCSQKISEVNLSTGEISDLVLIPCRKAECAVWRGGECVHLRKAKAKMNQSDCSQYRNNILIVEGVNQ
jgi:hypothetical protein